MTLLVLLPTLHFLYGIKAGFKKKYIYIYISYIKIQNVQTYFLQKKFTPAIYNEFKILVYYLLLLLGTCKAFL